MLIKIFAPLVLFGLCVGGCSELNNQNTQEPTRQSVILSEGVDASAGGDPSYIITTPFATYYLEKDGGGLSSMLDRDGIDWIGFHKAPGSAHKGEYRGFPNAVHKQDGNFFHAMNAGTDPSTSTVDSVADNHVRITVTSGNNRWQGHYDFYPDRLDFTMSRISEDYHYWVQYEGVPGGEMDETDFYYRSGSRLRAPIQTDIMGDLPGPEWTAFGDANSPRVIYMLNHGDDDHPDDYAVRADMTVFAFGRSGKEKFLTTPETFSIGFVESTDYETIDAAIRKVLE